MYLPAMRFWQNKNFLVSDYLSISKILRTCHYSIGSSNYQHFNVLKATLEIILVYYKPHGLPFFFFLQCLKIFLLNINTEHQMNLQRLELWYLISIIWWCIFKFLFLSIIDINHINFKCNHDIDLCVVYRNDFLSKRSQAIKEESGIMGHYIKN